MFFLFFLSKSNSTRRGFVTKNKVIADKVIDDIIVVIIIVFSLSFIIFLAM